MYMNRDIKEKVDKLKEQMKDGAIGKCMLTGDDINPGTEKTKKNCLGKQEFRKGINILLSFTTE